MADSGHVSSSPVSGTKRRRVSLMSDQTNKSGVEAGIKRRRVGLVYDERMCKHSTPKTHLENPNRIHAVWKKLLSAGIPQRCVVFNAKEAEDEYISAVHSKGHINLIKTISSKKPASKRNKVAAKWDSIYFNEGSSESAYLAAGSVLLAAEKVAKGELNSAFAIVRPPGHHAETSEPMGFCLYNNVAIATSFLPNQKELGINKILIVDWDVHHGNGTQKMFYKDPRVLVFSVHRHENGTFYPTGDDGSHIMISEGPGAGYNINVPWENDQCGDADYIAVWDHILIPVAREFKPDIIMISAGFDAAIGDPIGCCRVTPDGYSTMLKKLMEFSRGKTIMALEGGYNLDSLANSVLACVEVLLEDKPTTESFEIYPFESTWTVIKAVRDQLSDYWPILAKNLPARKLTSRVTPPLEALQEDGRILHLNPYVSEDACTQIKDLKEKLAQQMIANTNLASDILLKDKTIAEKDKSIAEKDKTIAEKDKTIATKDIILAVKYQTLADKDKEIESLKQSASTKTDMHEIKVEQLKQETEVLKKERNKALLDRHLLITKGLPHIVSTLFRSDDFFARLAKVMQVAFERGHHELLNEILAELLPHIALVDLDGYDSTVTGRYLNACKELYRMEFPYLKQITANADKPLEFIMNIKAKIICRENLETYSRRVPLMCKQVCEEYANKLLGSS